MLTQIWQPGKTCVTENFGARKSFFFGGHIKARPFLGQQYFAFLQLELAQKAEGYLEIYALDIVSRLLLISMGKTILYFATASVAHV